MSGALAEVLGLHGRRREAIVRRQDADFPHKRGEFCYTAEQTIQQLCVRRIVGSSETANFNCKSRDTVDASISGASPFVISYRAFAGLTRNPAGDRALSFSRRPVVEGETS